MAHLAGLGGVVGLSSKIQTSTRCCLNKNLNESVSRFLLYKRRIIRRVKMIMKVQSVLVSNLYNKSLWCNLITYSRVRAALRLMKRTRLRQIANF